MSENQGFVLPELASFGIRVKDVKKTVDFFSRVFGISPFMTTVFEPKKHWYKGTPFPIKLRIASFQLGPVKMDLIEDLGDSPHKWRVDSKGEAVDYLAFHVDDYDAWVNYLTQQGFENLQNAEYELPGMGNARASYMKSEELDGVIFEIAQLTPFE